MQFQAGAFRMEDKAALQGPGPNPGGATGATLPGPGLRDNVETFDTSPFLDDGSLHVRDTGAMQVADHNSWSSEPGFGVGLKGFELSALGGTALGSSWGYSGLITEPWMQTVAQDAHDWDMPGKSWDWTAPFCGESGKPTEESHGALGISSCSGSMNSVARSSPEPQLAALAPFQLLQGAPGRAICDLYRRLYEHCMKVCTPPMQTYPPYDTGGYYQRTANYQIQLPNVPIIDGKKLRANVISIIPGETGLELGGWFGAEDKSFYRDERFPVLKRFDLKIGPALQVRECAKFGSKVNGEHQAEGQGPFGNADLASKLADKTIAKEQRSGAMPRNCIEGILAASAAGILTKVNHKDEGNLAITKPVDLNRAEVRSARVREVSRRTHQREAMFLVAKRPIAVVALLGFSWPVSSLGSGASSRDRRKRKTT